ncbi:MAG: hypothetical protein IT439_02720 [Phycisphaerales bacterium]|nr:hypothetical protein [Phycisphaerales bacterium]
MIAHLLTVFHLAGSFARGDVPPAPFMLDEVTLVDPASNTTRPGMDVLVVGDFVSQVADEVTPPEDARIVDGRGLLRRPA